MHTRIRPWFIAAPAAFAALAAAPGSDACSRYPSFPTLLEPVFEAPDHVVESTRISLACAPRGIDAACELEARYRVRNRGKASVQSQVMILASQLEPRASFATANGETAVALQLTKADRRLIRVADCDESIFSRRTLAFAFDTTLAGGEARDLVVRSSFVIHKFFALVGGHGDCNKDEGVQHRHPFVGSGRSAGTFGFRYVMATNREVEAQSKITVSVRHPRAWEGDVFRGGDSLPPTTTRVDADDARDEVEGSFDPDHQVVHVTMNVDRGAVFNGGPYVAAHWSFAPDGGALLRAGYEIASPPWLLESVSLESDLRRRLVVVPAAEMVTSTVLVFGAGIGVPIRVRPELQIGGRLQLSASYGVFTLRGAFDAYPATSLLPTVFEGSLGPQISF